MPAIQLQLVDWLIIGSYFLILLMIGLYYRRFAGRSMEDYFLAGRKNSGWANGVSYAAALMNADVAPAYSGVVVATGLFVCWFYLSRFGLALFIGAVLFAVFWRRLGLFTTPEFYELRFGGRASSIIRTWVALRSSLIAMVACDPATLPTTLFSTPDAGAPEGKGAIWAGGGVKNSGTVAG